MKKLKYLLISLTAILIIMVCFSCEIEGEHTITIPTKREVKPIKDIIPQVLINQVVIHQGYDPPDITGGYLISPYKLTYSTLPHDSIGLSWGEKGIKFTKQSYENTIAYESNHGGERVNCPIAYIQGSGNNFTVYFRETKVSSSGSPVTTAAVISGTKRTDGISDLSYSYIVITPAPGSIPQNSIRKFIDGDYLATNYKW